MEKNDNKKKPQVIQHLHGISEVNKGWVAMYIWSLLDSFYGDYSRVIIEEERLK